MDNQDTKNQEIAKIEFKNVNKAISDNTILKNISFRVLPNTITSLVGLSGSGKTTLLRTINRLLEIDGGEILIDGKNVRERSLFDLRSRIGYVIQNAGLFNHMTIASNLDLVRGVQIRRLVREEKSKMQNGEKTAGVKSYFQKRLQSHKLQKAIKTTSSYSKDNFQKQVVKLFKILNLKIEHLEQKPSQLSGGQLQRVGIVRALLTNAEIILMDEPFSALDPIVRRKLQLAIVRIKNELKKTIIFVSHDPHETLLISDHIVVLDKGETKFIGTPEQIKRSRNKFIKEFFFYDHLKKAELEEE